MKLRIERNYFENGTNGLLFVDDVFHSHSIELPWLDNHHQTSCIPEGTYNVVKHLSPHLGEVMMLENVPDRDLIYIHPANNAKLELLGCIAPVTNITGQGEGYHSHAVFDPLKEKCYAAIDAGNSITIEIIKHVITPLA